MTHVDKNNNPVIIPPSTPIEYFEDVSYNFGEISPGVKNVKLEWIFKDIKKEDIDEVRPGCGCTAKIEIQDDRITGVYNDSTPHQTVSSRVNKRFNIKKTLRVYLKDGEKIDITNNRGVADINPKKKRILIDFSGVVVV